MTKFQDFLKNNKFTVILVGALITIVVIVKMRKK